MRVLNTKQMREADRRTSEEIGLPSIVLMENAGRQVVAAMESSFEALASMRVSVICGRGNNGGDGFVVARTLVDRDVAVSVVLIGESAQVKGDARLNLDILRALGIDVIEITDASVWELHGADVLDADLVVDALVGTGLNAPLSGLYETVVDDLNASAKPVVSIDLPSGLSGDSPEPIGPAVDATLTVTLAAPKLSLVLPPGETLAGTLVIADIGISAGIIAGLDGPRVELLTKDAMRALVQPRAQDSHKGDYGHVLVVAGSPGKTGAAALTALAALRSGAGRVTVAAPASCVPAIAALGAEFMTLALPEDASGLLDESAIAAVLAFGADVIAAGPGLGRSAGVRAFVHALVDQSAVPLVLDADALMAFAGEPDRLLAREGPDVIITPHPGEMAAMVGLSVDELQSNRLAAARDFASTRRVHVILKGHRTIVATPDGEAFINLTGNAGMATAGAGDVLTGTVAAWAGQLLDPEAACKLGVYLHGLAGDLAEADEGEVGMIAGDILDRLGDAVLDLTARRKKPRADAS
jgi:hydroxyethylthiazole kinase-like uncharacterized protein yjeF